MLVRLLFLVGSVGDGYSYLVSSSGGDVKHVDIAATGTTGLTEQGGQHLLAEDDTVVT